ncbi:MAG: polysaccharide biosynthesis tyrosine autokinase [Frankia sp.]
MYLRDYLHLFRRRWRVIVIGLVVGMVGAGGWVASSTSVYQADLRVFVALQGGASASSAYQGSQFVQDRVKSYVKVVNSPAVTAPVIASLRLATTPAKLGAKISATAPTDTVLVDIAVKDASPVRAQQIASAVGAQFVKTVAALETPPHALVSPVTLTVVQPPVLPTTPVSPTVPLDLGLGFLVGLAMGVAVAVAREALDSTVKTPDDLSEVLHSGALATIPFDPRAKSRPLTTQGATHSHRAEAFRALRTNLRFINVDHPPRAIVLTSSMAAEGKSLSACNLAITTAESGLRTILVDADLRRPTVARYMGLEGAAGLTDVLTGRAELDDVLQPWGDGRLMVLASGPLAPNPSELLGSQQMVELLRRLGDRFDFVVFDAPPLLAVTDAAILSQAADGALLIIRHGRTRREQLRRSAEALEAANATMLGSILNMVPAHGDDYYYRDRAYLSDLEATEPGSPAVPAQTVAPRHAASRRGR